MVIKLLIDFLNELSTEVDNNMKYHISIFVQQLSLYEERLEDKKQFEKSEKERIKKLNNLLKKYRRYKLK